MNEAKKTPRAELTAFSRPFDSDTKLFAAAVRVNVVYCDALFQAGILTRGETERVKNGLQTILKRADFYADFFEQPDAADVHSFIENRLVQLVGDAGAKIGVGRSRREQSLTAFRLWLRGEIERISESARRLQIALTTAAERQMTAVFPVFVARRRTAPILFAHWCLAHFEALARDRERLEETWRRVNVLPLGAADATGTAYEIDREETAALLEFEGVSANSLDAATDADFAIETTGALASLMLHSARLAEDLLNFAAPEREFIEFTGGFSTRSADDAAPEILETIRRRAAVFSGYQTALFGLAQNLPTDARKDFREIEKSLFEQTETVGACLSAMILIVENLCVDEARARRAVERGFFQRAELTDYLVQRNVSIAAAAQAVGKISDYARARNQKIAELTLAELQNFSENIGEDVYQSLSVEQSLASKNQIGGTAPERVSEALQQAKESLEREG